MMKKLNYLKTYDGRVKVVPKDLNKLLNLRYLKLTNLTHSAGRFSLPALYCRPQVLPDFLALFKAVFFSITLILFLADFMFGIYGTSFSFLNFR